MSAVALDIDFMRRRREEIGLTQRALGDACGMTPIRISRLEAQEGRNELGLVELGRLATGLDCDPRRLLRVEDIAPTPEVVEDAAVLGAALMEAGEIELTHSDALGVGLGWDPDRVRTAADALEALLIQCGLSLHRLPGQGFAPRGQHAALDDDARRDLSRARTARRGINVRLLYGLLAVIEGAVPDNWSKSLSGNDFSIYRTLLKMGAIEEDTDGRLVLTEDVRFSLGLDS